MFLLQSLISSGPVLNLLSTQIFLGSLMSIRQAKLHAIMYYQNDPLVELLGFQCFCKDQLVIILNFPKPDTFILHSMHLVLCQLCVHSLFCFVFLSLRIVLWYAFDLTLHYFFYFKRLHSLNPYFYLLDCEIAKPFVFLKQMMHHRNLLKLVCIVCFFLSQRF